MSINRYMTPLQRFWTRVEPCPATGCWIWTGAHQTKKLPYGLFKIDGVMVYVHRFSYEQFIGPIPEGLLVLHHCDTPECVAPHHLYCGTQSQNIRAAISRGRFRFNLPQLQP